MKIGRIKPIPILILEMLFLLFLMNKAASISVNYWIKEKYKKKNIIPAYISILHTFGRSLIFNHHIHIILIDGGISNKCK